jgi:hypothetical protein
MGSLHLPAVSKAPYLPFDCLIMSVCLLTLLAGEVNLEAGACSVVYSRAFVILKSMVYGQFLILFATV